MEQAFALFNAASSDLCTAYDELRQQALVLTDELALANGELRRQFAEKEALRESLARQERLAAMGEMAAHLAHRLRTPLATALLYASQLGQPGLPVAERSRFADRTVERLHDLERLIADMLQFVRGASPAFEPVAASDILQNAFHTIEAQVLARGLRLELRDDSAGCALAADAQGLCSALLGLLDNAMQASAVGGRIGLAVSVAGGHLEFVVSDTGTGIAQEAQARLFEPFFTTRRQGTGLGLALVRAVAEAHGGSVQAHSTPGAGSEFVMSVPLRQATATTRRQTRQPQEPKQAQGVRHDIAATADC